MKKKIIVDLSVKIEKPEWFERLSSFSKIVRVFCWMIRFVNKLRKKPSYGTKTLTIEEKAKAEIILWSIEQKKHFREKENSVHGLQVVRGDDEVLRVKTRIIEREDDLSFLYPILLPSKHYLTECLIREYHLKYCHAGVQILAAKLRLQYWIFSSKRNIRSCVSRCVVCKRFTAKALTTPPIQLPLDRKVTIPRLELLACVLGSRLAKYVVTALFLREVPTYYWADATVALCWIQREENWGVFVNNRVREIRSLTKKEYWRHIPGKLNPADIASRGCTLQHLLQYGWWEGPEFLKAFPEAWPKSEFSPNEELIAAEMKKKIIVDLSVKIEKPEWFERLSSFSKIVRVFCWMIRFVNKLRKKPSYGTKTLTIEEKAKAEIILWSIEQKKHFREKENSVHGLQVVRGDDEVLRVKTRIIEREDDLSFLYPILLPSKHYLTEYLIREYHLKYCHAGVQILAAKLRLQYWIFSSKRNIRSCVSRCVVCKRFTAKALTTPPIQLPLDRVRESAIFEITGIDLCGPLLLKPRGKAWIVLFTCAVYRAIHLEPLMSLSTESFMQTLRRFIARRGRPSTVYTDNATNFRGTDNALKKIDWQKISENECYPIKWKFNPPTVQSPLFVQSTACSCAF
ncbi:reverse transcriptase [Caerostris darwini]|uniref:Reverse transcriptase n=1 Tax=Caerostris darwini TaxID=1538125 RepID=A0AAV4NX25_9ARAC|nr:reverse transcriptase [Caerostris darwini]